MTKWERLTPEEKLLREIFGEQPIDYRVKGKDYRTIDPDLGDIDYRFTPPSEAFQGIPGAGYARMSEGEYKRKSFDPMDQFRLPSKPDLFQPVPFATFCVVMKNNKGKFASFLFNAKSESDLKYRIRCKTGRDDFTYHLLPEKISKI